jgi:hypothetical protein
LSWKISKGQSEQRSNFGCEQMFFMRGKKWLFATIRVTCVLQSQLYIYRELKNAALDVAGGHIDMLAACTSMKRSYAVSK